MRFDNDQSLKLENVAKTVNRYEEAITFAEADLHDYAKDLVYREEIERTKILVVGHDDTFSGPREGSKLSTMCRAGEKVA